MINSPVDEIKNRLDIVEVIGSYIKLQKAGANYRALCPFHSEKKPSFFVSPTRQIWHCFGGCSVGGDIFKFVMMIEGVEFGDALRILAQKAGVELKRQTPEYKQWKTERQRLHEVCQLATEFFEKQLEESKVGREAKAYLLNRGLSEESIKKWKLGYSPDTWEGLSGFLIGKGYKRDEIIKAGLAVVKEETVNINQSAEQHQSFSSSYDRFRGRIIFPIFDLNSQVVGFGGRVFKDKDKAEVAKYVNTPQTMLYDKSRIFYGLDKAKIEVRKKDACILVEGYTDVIMAHQTGSENVIATSGTALTPFQLKILKRYTENLILSFDMDVAGDTATKRGIDLAQTLGFNIKILRLAEGKDAAEIIAKNPQEWQNALSQPKSILEFYFDSAFKGRDKNTPEGKKEISKILLPSIKKIPNRIEQSYWIKELAKRLQIKEEDVEEELKKAKIVEGYSDSYGIEKEEIENLPLKSRKELLEESLLILLLKSPQNIDAVDETTLSFFSPQNQEILLKLKKKENLDSDFYNYLYLRAEIEEMEENEILPEINNCLKEINCLEIKNKLDLISREIKKAEEEKNSNKLAELTQEFNKLAKKIIK